MHPVHLVFFVPLTDGFQNCSKAVACFLVFNACAQVSFSIYQQLFARREVLCRFDKVFGERSIGSVS